VSGGQRRRARLAAARLYLCTPDRPDLAAFLDAVLGAGVDVVQLRDKVAPSAVLRVAAEAVRSAADRHGALAIVNDDPDLAVASGADGVHVGQDDVPPAAARAVVGPDRLVGLSTHSIAEVDAAAAATGDDRPDYLGVGPVNPTPTKVGRPGIGLDPVRHASVAAGMPFFVTGGMAPDTARPVVDAGAHGLVVVRAITDAPTPAAGAAVVAALRRLLDG
jgi:thiamine-phosphate pyrophosphorylase